MAEIEVFGGFMLKNPNSMAALCEIRKEVHL
jgi:hypothetical protein